MHQQSSMRLNIVNIPLRIRAVLLLSVWLLSALVAGSNPAAAKRFAKPGHGLLTGAHEDPLQRPGHEEPVVPHVTGRLLRGVSPTPRRADQKLVVWGRGAFDVGAHVPDIPRTGHVQYMTASDSNAAVIVDGVLTVWGSNIFRLNDITGAAGVRAIGMEMDFVVNYLLDNGTIVSWPPGGSQAEVPEAAKSNVVAISAGFPYYLALRDDGTVVEWWSGGQYSPTSESQPGKQTVPPGLSDVIAIAAGRASMALLRNGSVVVWGDDYYGQVSGRPAGLAGVTAIATGRGRCLALLKNGRVIMWGNDRDSGTVPLTARSNVTAIAAGDSLSLALLRNGSVVEWGEAAGWGKPPQANVARIAAGDGFGIALQEAQAPSGGAVRMQRPAADDS